MRCYFTDPCYTFQAVSWARGLFRQGRKMARPSLRLFQRVLPRPNERVLTIWLKVRAFLSNGELRMDFPRLLRGFLVNVRRFLARRTKGGINFFLFRAGFNDFFRIMVMAMLAFRIMGRPTLINGAIFRVQGDRERCVVC